MGWLFVVLWGKDLVDLNIFRIFASKSQIIDSYGSNGMVFTGEQY